MTARQRQDNSTSIRHGSTRTARLARWLLKTPPNRTEYTTLWLEVRVEGEWSRLQAWSLSDVTELLADDINATIQEYANEQGTFTNGRCAWWSEEHQKYWTTYDLRIAPEMGDGDQPVGQSFAGDVQSTNIQTQRHLEFMMRQHVGGISIAMGALRETTQMSNARVVELLEESIDLRRENTDLKEELLRTQALLDTALERAEGLAQEVENNDESSNVVALVTKAIANQQR